MVLNACLFQKQLGFRLLINWEVVLTCMAYAFGSVGSDIETKGCRCWSKKSKIKRSKT